MLNSRLARLKEQTFEYGNIIKNIPFHEVSYTPNPEDPAKIRHAKAFAAVMEQCNLNHIPDCRLVGFGGDKFCPRPEHLTEAEKETIADYPSHVDESVIQSLEEEMYYLWSFSWGHISPSYGEILRIGITGVLAKLEKRLEDPALTEKQRIFLEASLLEWNAVLHLSDRYRDFYLEKAQAAETDELRLQYTEMAERISRVPRYPAKGFADALQSIWFTHLCTQYDDTSNHSFGRFDQYVYPYYKESLEDGSLTEDEAREWFYEFWMKFTPAYKITEVGNRKETSDIVENVGPRNGFYWLTVHVVSSHHTDDGNSMDICGLDENGNDATNPLSHLIIDTLAEFRTYEPKPVIQYFEGTDPTLMKKCYELNASGLGHPALTYCKSTAQALRKSGFCAEKDIIHHCHIGCVELAIASKSYTDPMNAFLNLPKILLSTIFGGSINGKPMGLSTGAPVSFQEFKDAYYRQLQYFIHQFAEEANKAHVFCTQYYSRPLISAILDNCVEKAVPVDEGGTRYWAKCMNCCGFATTVDSLYAINRLVYEEKRMTLEELAAILVSDFEGQELLRQEIWNQFPKYGNGDASVDSLATEFAEVYCKLVTAEKTYIGTPYRPGLYSFYGPVKTMGAATGATPDGRRAADPISLNSAPSHNGSVKNGLSAVLQSVTSVDHTLADNASVIDLNLSGTTGPEIIQYINEYLASKNVLYAQFSVVNKEDLLEAQKHPELYPDLTVRVSGFSARFVVLDKDTQDEIIQRSCWN